MTSDAHGTEIRTLAELQGITGQPIAPALAKERDHLVDVHRAWLAASRFLLLATSGRDGTCDVSPKGDPAGFVHVVDNRTVAIPERPGNGRVDGWRNVLENPHVGVILLVPGRNDTLRINAGIVESGRDYALSDAFPHDIILDLTGGLSFRKGCYVGQEVVSRMQHRGTARKRPVIVRSEAALPATGTDLLAGGKPVGTLGSVSGTLGLAIVRIDRAADAMQSGTPITADGVPVTLELPAWTGLAFPQEASEVPAQ